MAAALRQVQDIPRNASSVPGDYTRSVSRQAQGLSTKRGGSYSRSFASRGEMGFKAIPRHKGRKSSSTSSGVRQGIAGTRAPRISAVRYPSPS